VARLSAATAGCRWTAQTPGSAPRSARRRATLTSLDSELLGRRTFDLAVIDEACQTTEPACWIPLLRCERVVAAGDHCQLPPTVVSPDAQREGFSVSLLERLMRTDPETLSRRLDVQYRMHALIMGFSSAEFYEGTLVAADEVAGRLLADLPGMFADEWTTTPVHFIDTAGASFDEELEPDGESRRNPGEADVVQRIVGMLVDRGLSAREIGVIAPYAAQTRLLRERFAPPIARSDRDALKAWRSTRSMAFKDGKRRRSSSPSSARTRPAKSAFSAMCAG